MRRLLPLLTATFTLPMTFALFAADKPAAAKNDAAKPAAAAGAKATNGKAVELTFADLRFVTSPPKQVPQEGSDITLPSFQDQIPEKVRGYDRQRIEIRGYMMPTVLEGEGVREFIIVTSPLVCCYGQSPDINEYIVVRMTGKPAPLLENVPLRFEGVLRVGDIYQNGYWSGIYALECDSVKV